MGWNIEVCALPGGRFRYRGDSDVSDFNGRSLGTETLEGEAEMLPGCRLRVQPPRVVARNVR